MIVKLELISLWWFCRGSFLRNNDGDGKYCKSLDTADLNGIEGDLLTASNVDYDNFGNALKIDLEPGNYQVDFYNANGAYLESDEETVLLGKINLEHPQLKNHSYTEKSYIMPFKAYKSLGLKSTTKNSDAVTINQEDTYTINVIPNPASDLISIIFERIYKGQNIKIYSSSGQMIFSSVVNEMKTTINIRDFENGLYTAVVSFNTTIKSKKFIIQHAK